MNQFVTDQKLANELISIGQKLSSVTESSVHLLLASELNDITFASVGGVVNCVC